MVKFFIGGHNKETMSKIVRHDPAIRTAFVLIVLFSMGLMLVFNSSKLVRQTSMEWITSCSPWISSSSRQCDEIMMRDLPMRRTNSEQGPIRKWAYALLIAGCNPNDNPYLGMLYSILASALILQRKGSKADIILMIQMSSKNRGKEPSVRARAMVAKDECRSKVSTQIPVTSVGNLLFHRHALHQHQ